MHTRMRVTKCQVANPCICQLPGRTQLTDVEVCLSIIWTIHSLTGTVIDIATTATQLQLSMRLTACIHPIFTVAVSNSASWAWASVSCHVASCPEFDNLQSTTLLPTQLPLLAYYLHTAASQPGQLTLSFGSGDVVFIIFILFVRYLDNWCAVGFPVLLKHLIIIHT